MESAPNSHEFYTALLTHDISNVNQTTRGYLEMLLAEQMGPLNDEQTRVLDICLRQCRRVQSLVDSVRHLERLQQQDPAIEPINLDATITTAIAAVQQEFSDQDVRVRFKPAGRVVLAEPDLQEVMRQLIGNAAHHNDSEVVEIDLELTQTGKDPLLWRMLIRDNGSGVEPARREHLFARVELARVQGSGLGLSLAATLVRRWGGRIWLEDTPPGDGAEFGLELPAGEALPAGDAPTETA